MRLFLMLLVSMTLLSCKSTENMSCVQGILVGGLLGGNATCNKAAGQEFVLEKATEEKANIYIYRPYSAVLGSSEIDVFVNNEHTATLRNKGYVVVESTDENIRLGFSDPSALLSQKESKSISLNLIFGNNYFVKVMPKTTDVYSDSTNTGTTKELTVEEISENKAIKEIKETSKSI